jgi:hypothetical protein
LKFTLTGVMFMEIIRNMVGCGAFRDGSI